MKTFQVLLIALLFQGTLYAGSCEVAIKYAQESNAKEKHQQGRLPDMRLRQYVFDCTDIHKYLEDLDELDKDLLYMKASNYTREEFENSLTKTENPQKFSDLLPKEAIDRLYAMMKKIYLEQEPLSDKGMPTDQKEISKAYSFINATFKDPRAQPLGHYYTHEDGYPYTFENELYKAHIVRVMSRDKGCEGSVMLELRQGKRHLNLWYPYDLRRQNFFIRGDLIILAPMDKKAGITVHHRFKDAHGEEITQEKKHPYIHFGWKAHRSNMRLRNAFLKYSRLCKQQ